MSDRTADTHGPTSREAKAIEVCEVNIRWYQRSGLLALVLHRGLQTMTVVLSAATAVMIVTTEFPKWVQALPAAVAAVAAGLNGIYHWNEDSIRWLATAQALRSELAAYQTQHPDRYGTRLAPGVALDHFVERVHQLVADETAQWQTLFLYQPRGPSRGRPNRPGTER
jgi:hypothetical protein